MTNHSESLVDEDYDYLEQISLSEPDISELEIDIVAAVLQQAELGQGALVASFEQAFANSLGRRYGIAVASGTTGLWAALRALDIGPGDEVIASAFAWHQVAHAILLTGATPVLVDMDYWSCTIAPQKVEAAITTNTKAILAGNTNGHPAEWKALQALAVNHGVTLLEDSTEAIGSRYDGKVVGSFGDIAVFDFSQPSVICAGEGGMLITDDEQIAAKLRYFRNRRWQDRNSVSVGSFVPLQTCMSNVTAALCLAQLKRLDELLESRKRVEQDYLLHIASFEGIKPPYMAADVEEVHWFSYLVHLGTRFSRSSRDAILQDLRTADIEAVSFCQPLHQQHAYGTLGYRKGNLLVTEKIADRALVLPFHKNLSSDHIAFIVKTAKDASVNVGAGAAIY